MNKSLIQLILVHFKTFFREPAILFWAVLFPIIMVWVLGVAFSNKGESLRTVYVTGESVIPEKITGEKVLGKETGNVFRIKFQKASEPEAIRAVKRGLITLFIEVKGDSLIYHFDPHNSDAQLTHLILERSIAEVSTNNTSIDPMQTIGTRYIDFLIPGMIALGIMNSCIWGIGWSLIESRMKKLLRRMVATPLKKPIFFASHMIVRIVLGTLETILLIIIQLLLFWNPSYRQYSRLHRCVSGWHLCIRWHRHSDGVANFKDRGGQRARQCRYASYDDPLRNIF